MSGKVFFDTNILIYAYDRDAGEKHLVAKGILHEAWQAGWGVISTQVLQEFYVNITRKIPAPVPPAKARGILENYLAWHVEVNEPETVLLASEIEERHRLSFRDAMIVAAAIRGGVAKILSEDFNHGQIIEGIVVENPLLAESVRGPNTKD